VLLWIGSTVAIAANRIDAHLVDQLRTPSAVLSSLTTPLAGMALAVALRAIVGILAFLLAVPLASAHLTLSGSQDRSRFRRMTDQWRLASALRAIRSTWAVRDVAESRLGTTGRILTRCETALMVLANVTFVAMIVFLVATAQSAPQP
jgi:hypothetical protein